MLGSRYAVGFGHRIPRLRHSPLIVQHQATRALHLAVGIDAVPGVALGAAQAAGNAVVASLCKLKETTFDALGMMSGGTHLSRDGRVLEDKKRGSEITNTFRSRTLGLERRIAVAFVVTIISIVGSGCFFGDFGPDEYKDFEIVNNLSEPVRLNISYVHQDETLPFDLSRTLGKTSWSWPNKIPRLEETGKRVTDVGTLIPSKHQDYLYERKVLVSAWADEGLILFQEFIEWDQLFIGSDEIFTLIMSPQ